MKPEGTIPAVGYERPNQGGSQPSEHLQHAYELLGDGEWHPYYRILVAVSSRVHPAKAYRHVIRRRVTEPFDEEERAATVRTGQREIARTALDRKERFEHRVLENGERQVRMLPFKERSPEDYSASSKKGWASKREQ